MFSTYADSGESEASSRETCDITTRSLGSTSVSAGAVVYQPRREISLLPKIEHRPALDVFEEFPIFH